MNNTKYKIINILVCILCICFINTTIIYAEESKCTVMVYMSALGGLTESANHDFNEMELAGSNSDVKIVVQLLEKDGSIKRYHVQHDTDMEKRYNYTKGSDMWELGYEKMTDPSTLKDFINWVKSKYPAENENYILILWSHGNSWQNIMLDTAFWGQGETYLNLKQVSNAINSSNIKTVKLLVMSACLMGNIETIYQLRGNADYIVASEQTMSPSPLTYGVSGTVDGGFLQKLVMEPSKTAKNIAEDIIDTFNTLNPQGKGSLFAYDLTDKNKIENIRTDVNNFGAAIIKNYCKRSTINCIHQAPS